MAKHTTRHGNTKLPYTVEAVIDLADGYDPDDVIDVITVPAETMVLGAGMEVIEEMDGTSTDLTGTVRVGTTAYTGALDIDAASEGDYAASAALTPVVAGASATTVNVLLSSFTDTVTAGKLRVFAVLLDVKDRVAAGIAQIGN